MSPQETIVIKYGGHAMSIPELRQAFGEDLAALTQTGMRFVIVHGGGPQIATLLQRLNIVSSFVNGLRVTDAATLEVVETVLCGQVNKDVVRQLEACGVPCAGISGEDGNLLIAEEQDPALGKVGQVIAVNSGLLDCLLAGGYVPVVAPVGINRAYEPLNINADTAAGAIAGALEARYFILVSDVPGVLDASGQLIRALDNAEIDALCLSGVISGGMIPKVRACMGALLAGAREAIILDGRQKNSLRNFLRLGSGSGTRISR